MYETVEDRYRSIKIDASTEIVREQVITIDLSGMDISRDVDTVRVVVRAGSRPRTLVFTRNQIAGITFND